MRLRKPKRRSGNDPFTLAEERRPRHVLTCLARPFAVAVPPPPATGLTRPGLELHEKLGQGGMGVVYRARDLRLDQPRAIKVIRRGPWGGEEARERFNREARAVARLDHGGVVRIFSL